MKIYVKETQKCKHVSVYSSDSISNDILFQNVYEDFGFVTYIGLEGNCLCQYIVNNARREGERER